MGFFSKKVENNSEEENKRKVAEILSKMNSKCSVCSNSNFYKIDSLIEGNSSLDLSDYTKGKVGVCPNCGFVAHGHVFHKSADNAQNIGFCNISLSTLNMVTNKNITIAKRQDISETEKLTLMNNSVREFADILKAHVPDYAEKVDVVHFIKLCYDSKFHPKS